MEGDSVVCPLEDNLKLELDGVLLLVDVDELHQHHGDADRHSHDGESSDDVSKAMLVEH